MNTLKTLLASALVLGGVAQASAQRPADEVAHTYPYAFVGVQGGGQAVLNGYKITDVITPTGAIQGGVWFSPYFGTRLQVGGIWGKEGVKNIGEYKFNYVAGGVDLLVNLSPLFTGTDRNFLDVVLLGGLGANKAWGTKYNELPNYTKGNSHPEAFLDSHVHNHIAAQQRLGLQLGFNLSPSWTITLEGQANHVGRRSYAHEFNGAADWNVAALAGITYKFGAVKAEKPVVEVPAPVVPAPAPEPKPTPVPQPTPKPAPAPAPKKLESKKVEIFYLLAKSEAQDNEVQKIAEVAQWLKSHPTAVATIKGYADKGTGNAELNARYARERAEKVAKILQEQGIAASRLAVSSYGDTIQPFVENDLNRCVIVVAEEK